MVILQIKFLRCINTLEQSLELNRNYPLAKRVTELEIITIRAIAIKNFKYLEMCFNHIEKKIIRIRKEKQEFDADTDKLREFDLIIMTLDKLLDMTVDRIRTKF